MTHTPLLEARALSVRHGGGAEGVAAVLDFSLAVASGECVGLVGESGAGKSQALLAPLRLVAGEPRLAGSVRLEGEELLGLREDGLDRLRGARVGVVFQDAMSSLTPHQRVGAQLVEVIRRHTRCTPDAAKARALMGLEAVRLDEPARRYGQYPHELSGGQRQRVLIALALACDPPLLIADEPTTALDATVQSKILAMLARLRREQSLSLVLVSHDFAVIGALADRVLVMYAGRIVEEGPVEAVMCAPRHPYTAALLACIPRLDEPPEAPARLIPGQPPNGARLPPGCAFHPRCPRAADRCRLERPEPDSDRVHRVACHFPLQP